MKDNIERATVLLPHIAEFLDSENLKDYYFIVDADGKIEIHFKDEEVTVLFRLKYTTDEIMEYIVKKATDG